LNAITATSDDIPEAPTRGLWTDAWRRVFRNRLALFMSLIVLLYVMVAFFVAFGWLANDWDQSVGASYEPPSTTNMLGTDIFGLSVLRKTLYGTKISMTVALVAALISLAIGVPLGAMAGYFRGIVDEIIVWIYSTLSSIPGLLLVMAFAFVLKDKSLFGQPLRGITVVYLALGLTSWVGICRLIRGEVIKHKQHDYVAAARAYGCPRWRIILLHLIPNVSHLIIIDFSLRFVGFIHAEVILSFLGLGVKDEPSWGVMIDDARLELSRDVWWQMAAATAAIFVMSLALNIVSDALRDALDPKLRE